MESESCSTKGRNHSRKNRGLLYLKTLMKKTLRIIRHPLGITVIVILLLTAGVFAARYVAWPLYKDWRQQRWLTMADKFHEQEDPRSAGLVLRKVVNANPVSLEAWELILSIAKEENSPAILSIYQQVAELKPADADLHYEWAATAVGRGRFEEGKTALEKVGDEDPNTFHRLAAAVAIGTKDFAGAEEHFRHLLEQNPEDQQIHLNLAILHLQIGDEEQLQGARRTLASLVETRGATRLPAIRALLTDALTHDHPENAINQMEALRGSDNLAFGDHFLVLRTLDRYRKSEYDTYMKNLMAKAEENPSQIRSLARFLNAHARRPALRQWLESLPQEIMEDQEINQQYIETLVFMNDLPALEARLREFPWEEDDFYRHAILAHTLREQDRQRESRNAWQRAVIAAEDNIRDQRILYLQASHWNWDSERIDLLDRIFQRNPREQWAFNELFAHYQRTRNAPELTRLFARQTEVNQRDLEARNNLAYLWLLQHSTLSRAHALAQETFRQDPENPQFRTTYAFSLYRQGRYQESLQVFKTMPEEEITAADRALHYSLILAANQKWEQALEASSRVPAQNLFREEDQLLEELNRQIAEHF